MNQARVPTQCSTNDRRRVLSSEDGHCTPLGTHSKTQHEPASEQGLPRFAESRGDRAGNQAERSEEDGSSTTEIVVERIR